ncbi:MAG: AzlC family ABC transporter permease [Acidimicrobiales bacterium]
MTCTATTLNTQTTRRGALEGARDIAPIVVAAVPVALGIGAVIGASEIPLAAGLASAPLFLGGAQQLVMVELLDAGVAGPVVIATVLLVGARMVFYAASLGQLFVDSTLRHKVLMSSALADDVYLVNTGRFSTEEETLQFRHAYYAGAASLSVATWTTCQALAMVFHEVVPRGSGLEAAAPIAFAGLLALFVGDAGSRVAAGVSGFVVAIAAGLPFGLATLVATAIGALAGASAQTKDSKR